MKNNYLTQKKMAGSKSESSRLSLTTFRFAQSRNILSSKLFNLLTLFIFCIAFCTSEFSYGQNCPTGNGFFELDGNAIAVTPNPPDDWDLIYNNTSTAQVTTGIIVDAPSNNDNAFV